jgi:hypothetical protein
MKMFATVRKARPNTENMRITRQGLFATSCSCELPNGFLQDTHFLEGLSFGIAGNVSFHQLLPPLFLTQKNLKIDRAPSRGGHRKKHIYCTTIGLRLWQDCRFQSLVFFLFTRNMKLLLLIYKSLLIR